jgi:hypothetical protein
MFDNYIYIFVTLSNKNTYDTRKTSDVKKFENLAPSLLVKLGVLRCLERFLILSWFCL